MTFANLLGAALSIREQQGNPVDRRVMINMIDRWISANTERWAILEQVPAHVFVERAVELAGLKR